ncbi:MAG: hemerythrin domain-containing protein [Acidobacteria bacterium]|nr:hemerythrin domain-containing protein [Acidobacteriota bacterium]
MSDAPASDLLRADHRVFEIHLDAMLDALKHLTAERVSDIRREFEAIQKLSRTHFDKEEKVFYPSVRAHAPQVLAQMDEEHAVVRETEHALEEMLAGLGEVQSLSQRDIGELYRLGIEFHDAVETHIIDEEDHLLKLIDGMVSTEEQKRLAAAMVELGGENR